MDIQSVVKGQWKCISLDSTVIALGLELWTEGKTSVALCIIRHFWTKYVHEIPVWNFSIKLTALYKTGSSWETHCSTSYPLPLVGQELRPGFDDFDRTQCNCYFESQRNLPCPIDHACADAPAERPRTSKMCRPDQQVEAWPGPYGLQRRKLCFASIPHTPVTASGSHQMNSDSRRVLPIALHSDAGCLLWQQRNCSGRGKVNQGLGIRGMSTSKSRGISVQ